MFEDRKTKRLTKGDLGVGYLAGAGLALIVSLVGYVWFTRESVLVVFIGATVAIALFTTIIYVSYLFTDIGLSEQFVWNVARWTAFGFGVSVLFSTGIVLGMARFPDSTLVPSLIVITIATCGVVCTLLGVVSGLREQHRLMLEVNQRNTVMNRVLRHNIKNAMNVIQGHASILADGGGKEAERSVDAIERAVEEIVSLSDAARKIDTLDGSTNRTPVDAVEMVEAFLDGARTAYRDATITADLPASASVTVDPLVRSALHNLVENAVEHGDRPPRVHVSVTVEDGTDPWVTLSVADNGPGIPESERAVLAESREDPIAHGNGLGLWLVKWIVDHHDGEFRIEDDVPRGAVVTMRLRATTSDAPSRRPVRLPSVLSVVWA